MAFFLKSHFLAIFEKRQFLRFSEGSTSAVCCPFELKIAWGLCLALKSSHINFQLKRTAHGGGADLAKTPFWASKGVPCQFWPFFKGAPKRHFWALMGALVCLNRLFGSFWPRRCILSNLFGPLRTLQNRPPDRPFCWHLLRKKVVKSADFGSKKLKDQTSCSKDTEMVKMSWLRNLCEIFGFWSKNRHFLAFFRKMSVLAHFSKKAIFAIFRRLHLRRVLSDWAENCVRALPCPKEFPYQFSAKTDSTRRRCGPRKNAIFGLKGGTLSI